MAESAVVSTDITCPGCHFECRLVKYQCGRGKEFFDLAAAGGEVPERRGPMLTPSEAAASSRAKPSLDERVVYALSIAGHIIQKREEEAAAIKAVEAVDRAMSFMSVPILAKRTMLLREELDAALDEAHAAGWLVVEEDERIGKVARLTDAGKEQAAVWKKARAKRAAEFTAPLSNEEKETLESLVRRLFVKPGPR